MIWEPENYVDGNYFQNEINDSFCKGFEPEPFGNILDIGCGDGHYTNKLAAGIHQGRILGIDSSAKMIQYAKQHWIRENLRFEVQNIEEFRPDDAFDFALSFWCLHWTNIKAAFSRIFQALKTGGILYAVCSSFSDNSILQAWRELARQNCYRDLTENFLLSTSQPMLYFNYIVKTLNQLPFKKIKVTVETTKVYFPTIDYFRNLILTMPFTKTFPSTIIDQLIDDMLDVFQVSCQRNYGGRLFYETRPIFLEAIK